MSPSMHRNDWRRRLIQRRVVAGLVTSWQRLAAPPRPANLYDLSQAQQDRWRRGTILSSYLAVLLLCAVLTLFGVYTNLYDTALIVAAIGVFVAALWLNKHGHTYVAGMAIILIMAVVIDGAITYYALVRGGLAPLNFLPMMLWIGVFVVAWLVLTRTLAIVATLIGVASILATLLLLPKSPLLMVEISQYVAPGLSPIDAYLYILIHPICMTLFVFVGGLLNQHIRAEMAREAGEQGRLARAWQRIADERQRLADEQHALNEYQQLILVWVEQVVVALENQRPLPPVPVVPRELSSQVQRLDRGVVPLLHSALSHVEAQRAKARAVQHAYDRLLGSVEHLGQQWDALARELPAWDWRQAVAPPQDGSPRGVFTRWQESVKDALDPNVYHMLSALRHCEEWLQQAWHEDRAQRQTLANELILATQNAQRGILTPQQTYSLNLMLRQLPSSPMKDISIIFMSEYLQGYSQLQEHQHPEMN